MASDALRLTDVQAFYGDSHILHGISFALQPGKVLALLGRNGSGKSTCISTIIGFLKPKGGEIRLFGEAIEGLSPERISHLGIGLVPQGRRIFPSLTVWENLVVARQRRSKVATPWDVDRIYDMFPRLGERHSQMAGTLSGGELQMLAIGRALLTNPRLLLMDEPSEGLAPVIVERIGEVLTDLRRGGLGIFLVEQNYGLALGAADVIYILSKGQVVWQGTASELAGAAAVRETHLGV